MNKIIRKIAIVFILVIISVTVYFIMYNHNNNILKQEEKQVEVLKEIYEEFVLDLTNSTVLLDESALQNIITKESFNDENIKRLKEVEVICENPESIYKLDVKYSVKNNILILTLSEDNGNFITQKYKLVLSL